MVKLLLVALFAISALATAQATNSTAVVAGGPQASKICDKCVPCQIRGIYSGNWLGPGADYLKSLNVSLNFEITGSRVIGGLFFPNKTLLSPVNANILSSETLDAQSENFHIVFFYTAVFGMPSGSISPIQCRYASFRTDGPNPTYEESVSHVYTDKNPWEPNSFVGCPAKIDSQGPAVSAIMTESTKNKYPECSKGKSLLRGGQIKSFADPGETDNLITGGTHRQNSPCAFCDDWDDQAAQCRKICDTGRGQCAGEAPPEASGAESLGGLCREFVSWCTAHATVEFPAGLCGEYGGAAESKTKSETKSDPAPSVGDPSSLCCRRKRPCCHQ